jgi:hypothetical protein
VCLGRRAEVCASVSSRGRATPLSRHGRRPCLAHRANCVVGPGRGEALPRVVAHLHCLEPAWCARAVPFSRLRLFSSSALGGNRRIGWRRPHRLQRSRGRGSTVIVGGSASVGVTFQVVNKRLLLALPGVNVVGAASVYGARRIAELEEVCYSWLPAASPRKSRRDSESMPRSIEALAEGWPAIFASSPGRGARCDGRIWLPAWLSRLGTGQATMHPKHCSRKCFCCNWPGSCGSDVRLPAGPSIRFFAHTTSHPRLEFLKLRLKKRKS